MYMPVPNLIVFYTLASEALIVSGLTIANAMVLDKVLKIPVDSPLKSLSFKKFAILTLVVGGAVFETQYLYYYINHRQSS